MIETFMFFSLGFLSASLLTLAIIPLVHNRAERLTVKRLDASIPLSFVEVAVSKDVLRAEFAMSTRRLELTIEQLRSKMMGYVRELSKKTIRINRLEAELDGKTGQRAPSALLAPAKSPIRAGWLVETENILADKEAEVAKLKLELDERSRATDAQRIEIVTLKIQIDALTRQIADLENPRLQGRSGLSRRRTVLRLAG